jgi:hypothetical protein
MNIPHGRPRGVRNKKAHLAFGTKIAGEHRRISGYDSDDPQFYHQNGAGAGLPALEPKMVKLPAKSNMKQMPGKQRENGVALDQSEFDSNEDHSNGVKKLPNSRHDGHFAPGLAAQKHSGYVEKFRKEAKQVHLQ